MSRAEIRDAIRDKLPGVRDEIKQVAECQKYEIEFALFDIIARKLADAILKRMKELGK